MGGRKGVRRWFRLPVLDRARTEQDVDAELSAHLEHRIERLVASGLTPAEARAEAERRLGGFAAARARLAREAWRRDRRLSRRERLRSVGDDVRYAARSVLRERGYAAVVVVTLALGIGANATMFGVLDRLLLSAPAHVVDADELQRVYGRYVPTPAEGERTYAGHNYPTLAALRERVDAFAAIGGYMARQATLGSGPAAREIELRAVTAGFLEMLGARPQLGRFMVEAEDVPPDGTHVVVLGDALWRAAFGARHDVLGETVELAGRRHTVIGVAPPGLTGTQLMRVDAWVPLSVIAADMGARWPVNWNASYLRIVGRLRPGATPEQAAQQATAAHRAAYDGGNSALGEGELVLAGLRAGEDAAEPLESRIARWLMIVSGIVLVVACANVANLYYARGLARRREVALRLALGISHRRLLRLLLAESLVLALLGGALALLLAYWGAALVQGLLLPGIDWGEGPLDARVLGVAALLTLVVVLATGLAPALQARHTDLKS
jgi:predicted permease